MTYARHTLSDTPDTLPLMPPWVTSMRAETPEDVAFLSGAALSHLHLVLGRPNVPQALLRQRLALRAAEACVTHSGRVERAGDLRDAVAFVKAGDSPGPAGEIYQSWQRAAARPVAVSALQRALPQVDAAQIAVWLDASPAAPIARAALVLEAVLMDVPRADAAALILADATLAQSLGWDHMLPVFAAYLKRADLRLRGDDLRLSCHRAVTASAVEAVRLARDLSRRAAHLRAVAPKLRAKGADAAVDLFLKQDAVAATDLTSLRSDRAARRFCDRLVELGAARELTGRDTFRLYGL